METNRGETSPRRRAGDATSAAEPLIAQPRTAIAGYEILDAHDFRNAVHVHIAGDRPPRFTIVVLRPDQPCTLWLASLLFDTLRIQSGDLVGQLEGAVGLYLHGARRADVAPLIDVVQNEWRARGGGELAVDVADHPTDEYRVIDLLAVNWDENEASLGQSN
jgi:hypothetical protein